MASWEYMHVTGSTIESSVDEMQLTLTALGSLGWEMCGFAAADRTLGLNVVLRVSQTGSGFISAARRHQARLEA